MSEIDDGYHEPYEPDEAEEEEEREYRRAEELSFDNALGSVGPWSIINDQFDMSRFIEEAL